MWNVDNETECRVNMNNEHQTVTVYANTMIKKIPKEFFRIMIIIASLNLRCAKCDWKNRRRKKICQLQKGSTKKQQQQQQKEYGVRTNLLWFLLLPAFGCDLILHIFSIASDQKPFCFHQTNTVAEAAVYKEQGKRVEVEKKLVR